MPWIFNYSELGPPQLTEVLGKSPFCMLPASLANYSLSFKGRSRKWGGGVASLDKVRGGYVYGSAALVGADDLVLLDRYFRNFERKSVPMFLDATQEKIKAIVYFSKASKYGKPSEDYLKEVLKHLKFFWGQGKRNLSLNDFGVTSENQAKPEKTKKAKLEKPEVPVESDVVVKDAPAKRRRRKSRPRKTRL